MSLKIYLLRHGETEYSQRGAYCGALDPELTTEGSQMAQAFADAYCSDTLGGCLRQSDEKNDCNRKAFM